MSVAYWRSPKGLDHITPGRDEWPEGRDFPAWLRQLMPQTSALEFGCGTGRLAKAWGTKAYVGADVSPHALEVARTRCPGYDFRLVGEHDELPEADVAFAHTVLLHVSDDELPAVVARLARAAPIVLVSEIMGRSWRRSGNPPVYNREPSDYAEAFATVGMMPARSWERPYHRYGGVTLTVLEFVRPT